MSGISSAIIMALEDNNIPFSFMVYDNDIALTDVCSKRRSNKWMAIASDDFVGKGGNEEGNVLNVSKEIVRRNQEMRNVIILFSDGGIDDVRKKLAEIRTHLSKMNRTNIYAMGYGSDFDEEYCANIFDKQWTFSSDNPKELATKLTRLLKKELNEALTK